VEAVKRGVDVGVIAPEAAAQRTLAKRLTGDADAREGDLLDEDVRRLGDYRAHRGHRRRRRRSRRRRGAAGMEQRDRRAVAVAHQDRVVDPGDVEQSRQQGRFVVEERHRTRQRRRVGAAVAESAVDHGRQAHRLRQPLGKLLPERHRAQAFVQEDERRRASCGRSDPARFDAPAVEQEARASWMVRESHAPRRMLDDVGAAPVDLAAAR
jgi:hypothetical protein